MGNVCDCVESQPPPEEAKKKKKETKRSLSAQQLVESTDSPRPKKKAADGGDLAADGDETEEQKKLEGDGEPAKVESEVVTHEAEVVADEEPEQEEGVVKKTARDEQREPLLEAVETSEPAAAESRKSSSSSSGSRSSSDQEQEKKEKENDSQPEPKPADTEPVQEQAEQDEKGEEEGEGEEEEGEAEEADSSGDEEESALVAGGSRLMRSFVDGCQIKLCSKSSSHNLRIMENGEVNALGGNGKRATFTVHVKGVRRVALQNVKCPERWLQVKDDELSGNGTGDEHCHFNLSEHGSFVVFEPVLAPGTHIGVRENGNIKKPSHTGTRKHARFTPIMKNTSLSGSSPLVNGFKTGRRVCLTSRAGGKSLRIVEKQVDGLGDNGEQASFFVHVRGSEVVALQNVKDPQLWLRIRNDQLQGNGKGGLFSEFKVDENDGHVTLESVAAPGHYVGINTDGAVTVPSETNASSETAHFTPNIKLRKAGDGELLSRFTEENVIVLESRASGQTLCFREGVVEGTGGHGAHAQFIVHYKAPGAVALQNKKESNQWLRIMDEELNAKGSGGALCDWKVEEVDGHVVLESVRHPGQHVGVRESGEVKKPSNTGKGKHGQFTPIVTGEDKED